MAPLKALDPPALLGDFNAAQKKRWSKYISDRLDREIARTSGHHFYNPLVTETATDVKTAEISWTAFPRQVQISAATDEERWQQADASRDRQDEYCEWSVERDKKSKITRVTFTCESPEYWERLGEENPAKVLELYQKHISKSVKKADLFSGGAYVARNKWNDSTTNGAMHLVQRENTLFAELNIAVRATIIRKIKGTKLTGERELIECGRYGQPERHSDPHIGGEINALARQDADVTIANPVGLYIRGLDTVGWETPDKSDPKKYWKIVRGDAKHAVRAVYEVPSTKKFTVGDITINGQPIEYGGQIADYITIKVVGQACRFGKSTAAPVTSCVPGASFAPAAAGATAGLPFAEARA
jgi:hypothetical protein